jgi:hypothetical protein
MEFGLIKSRGYLKKTVNFPLVYKGVHALCRLRVGAFWTIRRFVHIGWLPERLLTLCPFCNTEGTGETIHHLVVECTAWKDFRSDNFIDLPNLLGGSGEPGGVGLVGVSLSSWLGHENIQFQPDLFPQGVENRSWTQVSHCFPHRHQDQGSYGGELWGTRRGVQPPKGCLPKL